MKRETVTYTFWTAEAFLKAECETFSLPGQLAS